VEQWTNRQCATAVRDSRFGGYSAGPTFIVCCAGQTIDIEVQSANFGGREVSP